MKKFRYEENGYNRKDVYEFVCYTINEMEQLIQKIYDQRDEINQLRQQEDVILKNAKEYASKIINDALKEANNMEVNKELELKQQSILKEINQEESNKQ